MQLIESCIAKHINFAIYFRPGRTGGMFVLFVGGIQRTAKATLKGAQGAMRRIIDAA